MKSGKFYLTWSGNRKCPSCGIAEKHSHDFEEIDTFLLSNSFENYEAGEKHRLAVGRLVTRKNELRSIKETLNNARAVLWGRSRERGIDSAEFQLLMAIEGLYRIEKRRLNKELKKFDLTTIQR